MQQFTAHSGYFLLTYDSCFEKVLLTAASLLLKHGWFCCLIYLHAEIDSVYLYRSCDVPLACRVVLVLFPDDFFLQKIILGTTLAQASVVPKLMMEVWGAVTTA